MSGRTYVLLSIFGVLAALALVFALATNGFLGVRLQSYVLQIRRCAYLSEELCDRHPQCQAYYETNDAASLRPEFRECRTLPPEVQAGSPARLLCRTTGGQWRREKFGPYCNCAPAGKTWTVDTGCQ